MANIFTLAGGSKYMLDVGFVGDASARPLPLTEGNISQGIGGQRRGSFERMFPQTQTVRRVCGFTKHGTHRHIPGILGIAS